MKYLLCIIFLISGSAVAGDCHYTKVMSIQAQTGNVLIRVTDGTLAPWKNLGSYSSAGLNSYQSIAQQALATGAPIILRFPDGHECGVTDYGTVPSMIRIDG